MALTHFDGKGDAHMVDVSDKAVTSRIAIAENHIKMRPETLDIITEGRAKKGDVLGVARLAGIMAAKQTASLIPLCHPLPITKVSVELTPDAALPGIRIEATVKTTGQTGVEMEALTAASVAALAGAASAYRDAVVLNAAAALVVADAAPDLKTGVEMARSSLDSGAAREKLRRVAEVSQEK